MKLEDILVLNVGEIPNKPSSYTSAALKEDLKFAASIPLSKLASGEKITSKIDSVSKSQGQHDQLSSLSGKFFSLLDASFAAKQQQ